MEVPDLSVSAILSLDDHVSVVDQIEVSVFIQLRDDVEWSFDIESEFLIEFSLLWFLWVFININDIPLLVDSVMFVPYNDVSVLSINSSVNINDLSFLIDNPMSFSSEELPPS